MSLRLLALKSFSVGFPYPRPFDGKARSDLESEVNRLLHNISVNSFEVSIETRKLTVSFCADADRNRFYKEMDKLSSYSLDNIFSHPTMQFTVRRLYAAKDILAPDGRSYPPTPGRNPDLP